jgi:alkanesulfonate monooxygenase
MGVVLHWFLPTNGDSRTAPSLGNAVGAAASRVTEGGTERAQGLIPILRRRGLMTDPR